MQKVFDLLDASAKKHPIKALADEIGKAESTLRNELTEQPGYKLGLRTALSILKHTQDLSALDAIEECFGRVAFPVPKSTCNSSDVAKLAARVSREFADVMEETAAALEDRFVTREEAARIYKEAKELEAALLQLMGCMERVK